MAAASHSTAKTTRRCSRCRLDFPIDREAAPGQRAEWWLCAPCHDKLIGKGSRTTS
jgi:hypothetical protein